MKEIKMIAEYIREEIADAKKYAKKAEILKDTDKTLADTFFDLSSQELNHIDMLHAQVKRMINDARERGEKGTEAMQAVWEWEHGNMTEEVSRVRMLLKMYREV